MYKHEQPPPIYLVTSKKLNLAILKQDYRMISRSLPFPVHQLMSFVCSMFLSHVYYVWYHLYPSNHRAKQNGMERYDHEYRSSYSTKETYGFGRHVTGQHTNLLFSG